MNSLYLIAGIVIGLLNALIVILLYSRQEQIITKFLDKTVQNREKAQFIESVTPEEQLDEIFNIKKWSKLLSAKKP